MTTAQHSCPCGEATQKILYFELDKQPWVEFDHGLVIHRFELDRQGLIKAGTPHQRFDGA